jgi:hypothetical protein
MRKFVLAGMLYCLAACSAGEDVPIATKAVVQFHTMLDAGQNAQIYGNAAPDMKSAATEAKLTALLAAVHRKLGTVTKAEQKGWNDQINTSGHFITLNYATTYTRGEAAEVFVYKIADGKAQLAGYNVNSDALIVN